ncbi:uncharacterized protein B0T23DRAFT_191443 [Neurospora hispaniola]|uniref:Uncharacterized protein n=1 Tax=Neurospora hispaniola TaxID=588809 RepID=A0AAJ0MPA4_9PEZI|nr:hypothetical protein B0T23DRAFT_191443 [Neurospora hispaniola]
MVVMGLFAVFRMPFGLVKLPTRQFYAPHNTTSNPTIGALTPEYNAVIALYSTFWGFCVVYIFVFTCKTDAVLALPHGLSKLKLAYLLYADASKNQGCWSTMQMPRCCFSTSLPLPTPSYRT